MAAAPSKAHHEAPKHEAPKHEPDATPQVTGGDASPVAPVDEHQKAVADQPAAPAEPSEGPGPTTDTDEAAIDQHGANPASNPHKAGEGAKIAGKDLATQNAAGVAAVIDTLPAEHTVGEAGLVAADDPDALEDYIDDASTNATVVLKRDVYEQFYFPGTQRPSYRLAFTKGQVVARAALAERVAAIRLAAARGTGINPLGIDASTLASGTHPGVAGIEGYAQEQSPTGTSEIK